MSLTSVWNTVNNLANFVLSEKMTRRQIIFTSKNERLLLPVTPKDYQVTTSQNNPVVDILEFGEAQFLGNPKLQEITFSSFFPRLHHHYPFVISTAYDAPACVEKFLKWKEQKQPIRIIITDSPVNSMVTITGFEYKEQDTTKDIYYTLKLLEWKDLNTPNANNNKEINALTGLKERPLLEKPSKIEKARDILDASKKAYGDYKKWRILASKNNLTNLALKNLRTIGKIKL